MARLVWQGNNYCHLTHFSTMTKWKWVDILHIHLHWNWYRCHSTPIPYLYIHPWLIYVIKWRNSTFILKNLPDRIGFKCSIIIFIGIFQIIFVFGVSFENSFRHFLFYWPILNPFFLSRDSVTRYVITVSLSIRD